MLAAYTDKTAYALCIFALCEGPSDPVHVFEGRTNGIIVPARGDNRFGWDPVFQCTEIPGSTDTYAEMDKETKNSISHRYKALDKLRTFLIEKYSISDA